MDYLFAARQGIRHWVVRKPLAMAVVGILACGVSTAMGVFSVLHGTVLRPLPWPAADRLALVHSVVGNDRSTPGDTKSWNTAPVPWVAWEQLSRTPALDGAAAYFPRQQFIQMSDRSGIELIDVMHVSSSYFSLLGAQTVKGRLFISEEDRDEVAIGAVISYIMWRQHFGGREDVLGQLVTLRPTVDSPPAVYNVVGVLAPDFRSPDGTASVMLPLGPMSWNGRFSVAGFLRVIVRLPTAVPVDAVIPEISSIVRGNEAPDRRGARVVTLREHLGGAVVPTLLLVAMCSAAIFVISCIVAIGLLFDDLMSRRADTAICLALGGSRRQVSWQFVGEYSTLVSCALLLGLPGSAIVGRLVELVGRVPAERLGSAVNGSQLTLFGVFALITYASVNATSVWSIYSGSATRVTAQGYQHTRRRTAAERVVTGAVCAAAIVLVVIASVFGNTLMELSREDIGFDPQNLVVLRITAAQNGRESVSTGSNQQAQRDAYMRRAAGSWSQTAETLRHLLTIPGVESAAGTGTVPFGQGARQASVRAQDGESGSDQAAQVQVVTEGYFKTLRLPLLEGRPLLTSDRGVRSAVVSVEFSRRILKGAGVGSRFVVGERAYEFEVVGIVPNVKHESVADHDLPTYYVLDQSLAQVREIVIRTTADPSVLAEVIARALATYDPNIVVTSKTTMTHLLATSLAAERSRVALTSALGGIALLLAGLGLFGLLRRHVRQREREIGVRLALGAAPSHVSALIWKEASGVIAIGVAIGVPLAITAVTLAESVIAGIRPLSFNSVAGVAALLTLAATAAVVNPAHRAGRIRPIDALRT